MTNQTFRSNLLAIGITIGIVIMAQTATAQTLSTKPTVVYETPFEEAAKPVAKPQPAVPVDAITANKRLTEANPKNAVAFNNLAIAYATAGRNEEARDALLEAIRIDPAKSRFYVNLSVVYYRLKQKDESLRAAEQAVAIEPNSVEARETLCYRYGESPMKAKMAECYELLLKLTPKDAVAKANYAVAQVWIGNIDKGIEILDEVVTSTPSFAAAWNALGQAYFRKKKYSNAASSFKRAVEISPEIPIYRYNLGVTQVQRKNKAGAFSQYKLLKDSDPNLAKKFYQLMFADKLLVYTGN